MQDHVERIERKLDDPETGLVAIHQRLKTLTERFNTHERNHHGTSTFQNGGGKRVVRDWGIKGGGVVGLVAIAELLKTLLT